MYAPWEPKIVSPRPTKGDSHRPPNFVLDFSSFHTLSSDSSTSAIRFHVAPYFVPSKLVQLLKLLNVILYHPCCWHFGDLDPKQMSNSTSPSIRSKTADAQCLYHPGKPTPITVPSDSLMALAKRSRVWWHLATVVLNLGKVDWWLKSENRWESTGLKHQTTSLKVSTKMSYFQSFMYYTVNISTDNFHRNIVSQLYMCQFPMSFQLPYISNSKSSPMFSKSNAKIHKASAASSLFSGSALGKALDLKEALIKVWLWAEIKRSLEMFVLEEIHSEASYQKKRHV